MMAKAQAEGNNKHQLKTFTATNVFVNFATPFSDSRLGEVVPKASRSKSETSNIFINVVSLLAAPLQSFTLGYPLLAWFQPLS